MLARLRKRLSYANVMATLALFMALGGVSYAASIAPRDSVRSSSIKNGQVKTPDLASNAVTSKKIKNGQVAGVDIASNAVSSAKIADGSVARNDLAAGAKFRAWGAIASGGALSLSTGIASVNHPQTGVYCVVFDPRLGVTRNSLVVPLLQTIGSTQSHIEVRWETTPSLCAAGAVTLINFNSTSFLAENASLFVLVP